MERERKVKVLSLVALIVAVLGLTVAFASLSQTLTITGTASVDAATWDIHFEEVDSEMKTTGGAKVETQPTLENTTISGWDVVLTKPGDKVTYEFKVKNGGTIDAKIGSLVKNALTCTGNGSTKAADEGIVCGNVTYTLKNKAGSDVATDQELAKNGEVNMVLELEYKESADKVPADDVTITIPEITITYVQK